MKSFRHKLKKNLWVPGGFFYGIISVLFINYSINKKIIQGIFVLKDGNMRVSILLMTLLISILISVPGYFNRHIFSITCYSGFSFGMLLFAIGNLCSFCGFESVLSIVGMLYIDIFTIVLAAVAQITFSLLR